MEYTVYPLYKKTHLIYSPPQHLGSPAHVAYYLINLHVNNIFDVVNVCVSVTKCSKAEITSTNHL